MARPRKADGEKATKRTRQTSVETLIKKRDKMQAELDKLNAQIEAKQKAEAEAAEKKKILEELKNKPLEELQQLVGAGYNESASNG